MSPLDKLLRILKKIEGDLTLDDVKNEVLEEMMEDKDLLKKLNLDKYSLRNMVSLIETFHVSTSPVEDTFDYLSYANELINNFLEESLGIYDPQERKVYFLEPILYKPYRITIDENNYALYRDLVKVREVYKERLINRIREIEAEGKKIKNKKKLYLI